MKNAVKSFYIVSQLECCILCCGPADIIQVILQYMKFQFIQCVIEDTSFQDRKFYCR